MADVGNARVEIVGDVARFARRAEREINAALRNMQLRPIKLEIDVDHARDQAQFLADEIETTIADIDFSPMRNNAAETVREIEDEFRDLDFSPLRAGAASAMRDVDVE